MELDVPEDKDRKSALNNWVAATVVVLSVVTALCKIKDDNIVQAMQVAKADVVDTWAEYQSKRLKIYINESALAQAKLTSDGPKAAEYEARLQAKVAELNKDSADLKAKAQGLEKQYDALGYRDDQFDLSDALLSIAIAVAAVAALTEKRSMVGLSWLFGLGGTIFGVAGFAGWSLHPDWIIKFLT